MTTIFDEDQLSHGRLEDAQVRVTRVDDRSRVSKIVDRHAARILPITTGARRTQRSRVDELPPSSSHARTRSSSSAPSSPTRGSSTSGAHDLDECED